MANLVLPPITIPTTPSDYSASSSAKSSAQNTPMSAPFPVASVFGPYQSYYKEIPIDTNGKRIPPHGLFATLQKIKNKTTQKTKLTMHILPARDPVRYTDARYHPADGRYLAIFKDCEDNSFIKPFFVTSQRKFCSDTGKHDSFEQLLDSYNANVLKPYVFSFEPSN